MHRRWGLPARGSPVTRAYCLVNCARCPRRSFSRCNQNAAILFVRRGREGCGGFGWLSSAVVSRWSWPAPRIAHAGRRSYTLAQINELREYLAEVRPREALGFLPRRRATKNCRSSRSRISKVDRQRRRLRSISLNTWLWGDFGFWRLIWIRRRRCRRCLAISQSSTLVRTRPCTARSVTMMSGDRCGMSSGRPISTALDWSRAISNSWSSSIIRLVR